MKIYYNQIATLPTSHEATLDRSLAMTMTAGLFA